MPRESVEHLIPRHDPDLLRRLFDLPSFVWCEFCDEPCCLKNEVGNVEAAKWLEIPFARNTQVGGCVRCRRYDIVCEDCEAREFGPAMSELDSHLCRDCFEYVLAIARRITAYC